MLKKSTSSTTPLLFIYATRHGTLYNLTPTNFPKQIPAISINYGDFHDHIETLRNLPQGINFKKFIGFNQKILTYLTPYDFYKLDCMAGCQYDNKVKIKCNKGYTEVTAEMYDQLIDVIKPDYFVGLTQYPSLQKNHQKQSNKSYKRSISKTKSYLQLSKHTKNQQIQMKAQKQSQNYQQKQNKSIRLAALHGGTNLPLITRSLQQLLDFAIDGIVVCDLCQGETLQQREQVYNVINQRLQQEYSRQNSYFKNKRLKLVLAGQGKLPDIQHAINYNFQAFQISYPFILAQKHQYILKNSLSTPNQPIKHQNLNPLDHQCKCHTCLNHSESYIAHLVQCHQMTAKVLLSIHNAHVYQKWLQEYQGKLLKKVEEENKNDKGKGNQMVQEKEKL